MLEIAGFYNKWSVGFELKFTSSAAVNARKETEKHSPFFWSLIIIIIIIIWV